MRSSMNWNSSVAAIVILFSPIFPGLANHFVIYTPWGLQFSPSLQGVRIDTPMAKRPKIGDEFTISSCNKGHFFASGRTRTRPFIDLTLIAATQ